MTGKREGLSNRYVTSIRQGNDGLIWVGTNNGLNLYDGYSFKQYYTHTPGFQLSGSRINALFNREDGSMFIGTNAGLNILLPDNHENTVLTLLAKKEITSFCDYGNKTVLVGTAGGEIIAVDAQLRTTLIHKEPAGISGLYIDSDRNTWFYTDYPNEIYKPHILKTTRKNIRISEAIQGNFVLTNDTVLAYCNSKRGLCIFDVATGKPLPNKFLDSLNTRYRNTGIIYKDKQENYWITYEDGVLIKINLYSQLVEDYSRYFNRNYLGSTITCIYEDKNNMMWVGTDAGFIKIPQLMQRFKTYLVNPTPNNADRYISTRGILSDEKDNIYFGTYKGLFVFNRKSQQMECFFVTDKRFKTNQPVPYQMIPDGSDHILITSYTKGLLRFNTRKKTFETPLKDYEDTERLLLGIFRDSSGTVWVGSRNGVHFYDAAGQKLIRYQHAGNKLNVQGEVWDIAESAGHTIWIGSSKGLYKLNKAKGIIRHYNTYSNPALVNNEIVKIVVESDSILWMASKGGGLIKLNIPHDVITSFNTIDGLADNIVYGIIPDGDFLWLSTENGLSRFDKKRKQFRNYYEKDGISNNEFNAGSMCKTADGEFFFGGVNGVTSFYPADLPDSLNAPQIILTALSKSSEDILFPKTINLPPLTVNLSHNDKLLSVRFSLTDFYQPQFNSFLYQLSGIDTSWVHLEAQNFLRINHLPAGQYTLLIKGRNLNGVESSNRITIHIHVAQVFYKQAWFIVLLIVAILAVIYAIFRFRIGQLLKLQQLRTKIASDLHDEVGSMLTRISILTELLKYKNQNNPEIEQIATASRSATTMMSDVLWSVDARNDKMGNLLDRMREHADALLLPLNNNISFTTNNIDMGHAMNMQSRQNLLLIFKEAVNNIAKHSNATDVIILIENNHNGFHMVISDNGSPVKERSTGSGQGLKNMAMRAEEIGATLVIQKENGFHITLTRKAF